ncbi:MAG: Mrp/NBP35 family ATP-binding protein [Ilumatobacteraceae bacterium]
MADSPDAAPALGDTAAVTPEAITEALRSVIDPELGVDIVTLGMVPDVAVQGRDVTVTIKLTIGGCPLRAEIKREVTDRVSVHPGVDSVHIEWGEMTPEERSKVMSTARWNARENAPDTAIAQRTRVLAIASGKGGVGKSSITVNLAAGLAAAGHTVGVLDADIWGFSVPRLLGMSDRMDAHEVDGRPRIIPNRRTVGDGVLEVVSTGFLVEESTALMWRGLMLTKAVEQFLRDVAWGDLDYLLIDMPPGTGDVQMGLARLLPRTEMIVVTTPARAAQTVAQRAADMAARSFLPVIGVIENMSAFVCEHGTEYALFGSGGGAALADAVNVPLLGSIPMEAALAAGGDDGEPVVLHGEGPAATALRAVVDRVRADVAPVRGGDDAVDMSGCSARLLDAVNAALDAADV